MLNNAQATELGKRLANLRKAKELSQEEVAEMLGISKAKVAWMETGRNGYYRQHERVAVMPFLDLYGASVEETFKGIYEMDDKISAIKRLTNEVNKLKAANEKLEESADMWQAKAEQAKSEQQAHVVTIDSEKAAEIGRLEDQVKMLEEKVRELQENQKSPAEQLLLKMLQEKYL